MKKESHLIPRHKTIPQIYLQCFHSPLLSVAFQPTGVGLHGKVLAAGDCSGGWKHPEAGPCLIRASSKGTCAAQIQAAVMLFAPL